MAGETFVFEVTDNVTAALDELAERAEDMTPAMAAISRYLVTQVELRFDSQTDPQGHPWKPSQRVAGYTDAHGKHHPGDGGQTLTLDAHLRRSMREDYGRDYASAGPEASGPAAIYAGVHQWGATIRAIHAGALKTPFGPRAAVKIPARPYLGFNPPEDGPEVIAIIRDHLAGAEAA